MTANSASDPSSNRERARGRVLDLSRRALVQGVAGAMFAAACSRAPDPSATAPRPAPAPAPAPPPPVEVLSWTFAERGLAGQVALMVPAAHAAGGDAAPSAQRFPVLIALHGRGEAAKSPAQGALGWPRDYALVPAVARIAAPPLTPADFQGLVDGDHLEAMNRGLQETPFQGLIVVCPYVPDLDLGNAREVLEYGGYLREVLLPRVRRDLPAFASPASTGLDGVSLGGAVALRVGLTNPEAFGAVGALQPAIGSDEAPGFAELARAARTRAPSQRLRLTTSRGDYFREAVHRLDDLLQRFGVAHDFAELPGPHDYVFNRGPGALEMLFWQSRALARA